MLPLVWAIVNGKKSIPQLNSKEIERQSQKIIDVMAQHGTAASKIFEQTAVICNALGEVTADRLKRQVILQEMLALV